MSIDEVVHDTLESDFRNDIEAMGNKEVHDSLESDDDTPPNTHIRSTSAVQRDARQKRTGASNKKRRQHQNNKTTRDMMPRGRNDSQHRGNNLITRYMTP